MATAQQRLDDVRTAISDILKKGQSISKDGRRLDRAQLGSLQQLEAQYVLDAEREARGARPRQVRLYSSGKGA
ncbi:hypothetical protein [Pseudomonas sp. LRF_L74]|uniref:hypothetical protein n=1 Tax=Pseudomonas sp. LRF_L74 TaxID=3369422 RepID=UPI003F5F623F